MIYWASDVKEKNLKAENGCIQEVLVLKGRFWGPTDRSRMGPGIFR